MDFNIKPLGVSVEQFRNNPKLQIEAAANLANQFKSQFTEEDRKLAKEKGYNENALLAGAWLGGVGGVRKVLRGEGNPSDKHWSKEGKGTTVKDRMDKFNKMKEGGVLKYEDGKPIKYGTKEYATAYNNGNLTRYDEATNTYVAPELEEAKVVAKNYNPVGVAVSRKLNDFGNKYAIPFVGSVGAVANPQVISFAGNTLKNWLPKLSFTSAYGPTIAATIADAVTVAVPTGLAAKDMIDNGVTTQNAAEVGLGLIPILGNSSKSITTILNKGNNVGKEITKAVTPALNKIEDGAYKVIGNTKLGEKFVVKQQNKAFQKGVEEIMEAWNGSKDMSNIEVATKTPSTTRYKYSLNPNIEKRMIANGDKPKEWFEHMMQSNNNNLGMGLYDDNGVYNWRYRGNPDFNNAKIEFSKNHDLLGYNTSDPSIYKDVIARRRRKGVLRTPREIRGVANHETAHLMQNRYGINLDKQGSINPDTPIGDKFIEHINPIDNWNMKGNEHHAESWRYRMQNGIGTRDFTDKEAKEFIDFTKWRDMYRPKEYESPSPELIEGIKMLQTIIPIGVGTKIINGNE